MPFVLDHLTLVNRKLTCMIKSCTDVATSLETILTLCPTPFVLLAAFSNNKNVYVLDNNLRWHNKKPRMAYNIRDENSERARNSHVTKSHARSKFSSRML